MKILYKLGFVNAFYFPFPHTTYNSKKLIHKFIFKHLLHTIRKTFRKIFKEKISRETTLVGFWQEGREMTLNLDQGQEETDSQEAGWGQRIENYQEETLSLEGFLQNQFNKILAKGRQGDKIPRAGDKEFHQVLRVTTYQG